MGDRHARELCRTLGEAGDTLPFSKLDATVRYGTVRAGHGLQINLTGRVSDDPSQTVPFRNSKWWWRNGRLDVHGRELFAALPHGLGSMAQMLLPVKALIVPDESELDRGVWKGSVTFGAKQLSSGRLDSTLADIVARGDPPFVVELRHDSSQLLGFLPTRASLIQKGLATAQQPVSVRDDGPLGDFRKSQLRLWAGYLRWWLLPLLFIVSSWHLSLYPEQILAHTPAWLLGTGSLKEQVDVSAVLPPHPRSIYIYIWRRRFGSAPSTRRCSCGLQGRQTGVALLFCFRRWNL